MAVVDPATVTEDYKTRTTIPQNGYGTSIVPELIEQNPIADVR
jgi:hypothetical protein